MEKYSKFIKKIKENSFSLENTEINTFDFSKAKTIDSAYEFYPDLVNNSLINEEDK